MNSKISLVLQGPLTLNTLLMVKYYGSEYEMTIVAPVDTKNHKLAEELRKITQSENSKVSFFLYNPDILKDSFDNYQNRFYQIYSTLTGIKNSKSDFVVKFRNDEFYSNIDPFLKRVLDNPHKIITSDIFFRKSSTFPFHISDHIVGGRRDLMEEAFSIALGVCEKKSKLEDIEIIKNADTGIDFNKPVPVEQLLTVSFISLLTSKYGKIDKIDSMKNNFSIVSVEDLGLYNVKQNHKKEEFFDYSFFKEDLDVNDIEKYE